MPSALLYQATKNVTKVAAKWTGFFALVGVVNVVPIVAAERSGFLPQRKFEQGFKDQVSRYGNY